MISRKEWLSQFKGPDQQTAAKLLSSLHIVSHDEFARCMERSIERFHYENHAPTAVFVEREVKKSKGGRPCRLFSETKVPIEGSRRKALRATGAGPAVIFARRGDKSDVGSEGLLASITGQLARNRKLRFVTNPSPNLFRRSKIRHFVVVTDLIGSGDRVWNFIEAAWKVRSVKSWHSRGWLKFTVIAYAATNEGQARVKTHPSRPDIRIARECPTIKNEFSFFDDDVAELCRKYYKGKGDPLGYGGTGALVVFRHGCPNNVPPILYEENKGWVPLFPGRVGGGGFDTLRPKFAEVSWETVLAGVGQPELGSQPFFVALPESGKKLTLILFAIKNGMVRREAICSGTQLPLHEIDDLLEVAVRDKLVSDKGRLTDLGVGTLQSIKAKNAAQTLPKVEKPYYYPRQLRLPSKSI